MKSIIELRASPSVHIRDEGPDGCAGFIRFVTAKRALKFVASWGMSWDHLSISLPHRCPTWDEMDQAKRLFFKREETAMQLHVPPAEHVNCHPHCLHIWRPHGLEIPRPPEMMVA